MSIYRSNAGKQELLSLYENAVGGLSIPVEENEVDTRHGVTHLLECGPVDGPPVILFHGGNATNPMTLAWYTDLANQFRLIAPDTIGQPGKSAENRVDPRSDAYGQWVEDLLDELEIHSAPMIGTSYGAGITLRVAAYAPDRVEKAALVVPAGFGTGPILPMIRLGLPSVLYRFVASDRLLDRVINEMVTEPESNQIVRETIAASLRHVKLERQFPSADRDELQEFTSPVHVYATENDPFFPAKTVLSEAEKRLPNLNQSITVKNEKHILSQHAQTRVSLSIQNFLETRD